ncbi:3-deoxy-manno-octulosonate cytidylyltransferase [bacterium]|nr:3-deoxy-manno-octulosonate cytidylyltransferase [bacterium]
MGHNEKTAIIIPARYGSTRLEGKPLLKVNDKPIIQWVYEKAANVKSADCVIVATDDERIYNAVKSFGGQVEMTSTSHKCGTDRIKEVVDKYEDFEFIVNLQGDEPMIKVENIELVIDGVKNYKADISTLIRPIDDENEINNPNLVKCVIDNQGYALYFSRSKIPFERKTNPAPFYGHVGIYGYTKNALTLMTNAEQTSLEIAESLEQLRALQMGLRIKTAIVNDKPLGIDTLQDFEEFKELMTK